MSTRIGRAAAMAAIVLLGASIGPGMAGAAPGPHFGHGHGRHHHHVSWLTAEQRQCLANQARSVRPGAARNRAARVAAWKAALEACGVTFPPGKPPASTTTTTTTTEPPPIEPS